MKLVAMNKFFRRRLISNLAKTFICLPTSFKDKCFIYPPTVKQVLGEEDFDLWRSYLTISQEDIEDQIYGSERTGKEEKVLTPLEFLLANCYHNKELEEKIALGFEFFIHKKITFLYDLKAILIGDLKEELNKATKLEDLILLDENDYFDFQNALRMSLGESPKEPPVVYKNPRLARMKAKARYRDRVKAKQNTLDMEAYLATICCMGIGINPLNIGELSYASLSMIMSVYQHKEGYELDIQSLLAGGDAKKIKPKYWIRNLTDEKGG